MNVKRPHNNIQQQHINQAKSNNVVSEGNNKQSINSSSLSDNNNHSSNPFIQNKSPSPLFEPNSPKNDNNDEEKDDEDAEDGAGEEKEEEEEDDDDDEDDIIKQKKHLLGQNLPDGNINNMNNKMHQMSHNQEQPRITASVTHQHDQVQYPTQLPHQNIYPNQINPMYFPNMANHPINLQQPIPMMPFPYPPPYMMPNIPPMMPQYQQTQSTQVPYHHPHQQTQQSNKQEEELMQLKVKLSNIETENIVLHDKIKELLKSKPSSSSASIPPKTSQKDALLIKELKMKLNELESEKKSEQDTILNKLDHKERDYNQLVADLKEKSNEYGKLNTEKERLVNYIDTLKKDIANYKKDNERLENDNNRLYEQVSLTESKCEEMIQKKKESDSFIKSIKSDYEILNQKYFALKKENERHQNDIANYKEQNYFVRDNKTKQKQSSDKQKRNYQKSNDQYNPPSHRNRTQAYNTHSNQLVDDDDDNEDDNDDSNEEENLFDEQYKGNRDENFKHRLKSESNQYPLKGPIALAKANKVALNRREKDNKKSNTPRINIEIEEKRSLINKLKEEVSNLVSKKEKMENELFKIPDKNKTVKDIQDMQLIEKRLDQIENALNQKKRQLRELARDD